MHLEKLNVSKYRKCICYSYKYFVVYLVAEHLVTGQKVAVKILNKLKIKNMEMSEKVRREINILNMCTHPHICRL